jgi:hypothetical protein
MSCGSYRAVINNTAVAPHVCNGTEQLHPSVLPRLGQETVVEGLAMLA